MANLSDYHPSARIAQLNALSRWGNAPNFLVLFTGDDGGSLGETLFRGPLLYYLVGLMLPLIVLVFLYPLWLALVYLPPCRASRADLSHRTKLGGAATAITYLLLTISFGLFVNAASQGGMLGPKWTSLAYEANQTGLLFQANGDGLAMLGQLFTAIDFAGAGFVQACAGHQNVTRPVPPRTARADIVQGAETARTFGGLMSGLTQTRYSNVFQMVGSAITATGVLGLLCVLAMSACLAYNLAVSAKSKGTTTTATIVDGESKVGNRATTTTTTVIREHPAMSCTFIASALVLVGVWLVTALVHLMATSFADMCTPDVDAQLARIAMEATLLVAGNNVNITAPLSNIYSQYRADPIAAARTATGNISAISCSSQVRRTLSTSDSLCYMMTCEAPAPFTASIQDAGLAMVTGATQIGTFQYMRAQAAIANGPENNITFDVPMPAACDQATNGYLTAANLIGQALSGLAASGPGICTNLNAQYRKLAHDELCLGFADTLANVVISLTGGGISFMLAFFVYAWFVRALMVAAPTMSTKSDKMENGTSYDVANPSFATGGPVVSRHDTA